MRRAATSGGMYTQVEVEKYGRDEFQVCVPRHRAGCPVCPHCSQRGPGGSISYRQAGPSSRPDTIASDDYSTRRCASRWADRMREWVRYRGEGWAAMSCGFMFRLQDGHVLGAIPAPAIRWERSAVPWSSSGSACPVTGRIVAEFDTLHGLPGTPRTSLDLRVDYVLLQTDAEIDPYSCWSPTRAAATTGRAGGVVQWPGWWRWSGWAAHVARDGPDGHR